MGSGFSIAWRTFDAQYWGVPQRRRRIYLVADFGGECAGEILFEPQGVRRDSAQSRAPGKEAAADASKRVGRSSECLTQWDMQTARIYDAVGSGPALSANSGGLNRRAIPVEPDVFPSLTNGNGHMSVCDGIPNCVVMPKCDQCSTVYGVVSKGNGEAFIAKDRHTALSVGGGQAGQGYPCVMIADEDAAAFDAQNTRAASEKDDSTNHQSPVCYRFRGYGDYVQDYVASTQRAAHDKMTADMVVSPGPKYIVRRLTPVECAR